MNGFRRIDDAIDDREGLVDAMMASISRWRRLAFLTLAMLIAASVAWVNTLGELADVQARLAREQAFTRDLVAETMLLRAGRKDAPEARYGDDGPYRWRDTTPKEDRP